MINLFELRKAIHYAEKIELQFEGRGIRTLDESERRAIVRALGELGLQSESRKQQRETREAAVAAVPDMRAALRAIVAFWNEFPGMEPPDDVATKVFDAIRKSDGAA